MTQASLVLITRCMRFPFPTRTAAALAFAAYVFVGLAPANALIKFNDGHDELFVTATAGISYDSNIYARADAIGDTTFNATLDLDYQRKAGLIGVNANLGWRFAKFDEYASEDFANPHARAEFTKGTGRTTGSLTLGAARENRADAYLNTRTTTWTYDAGLNVKYPVIERYSISGQLGYDYQDILKNAGLYDIRAYTAAADLFYVYTSERDILGGYRLRVTDTTARTRSYDHAFTLGTTGKLLPKLNGSARFGYQLRETDRDNNGVEDSYSAFTMNVSSTWTISRRLNITGQAARDFSTLASDTNIDTTSANVLANFAATTRVSIFGGAGVGRVRFFGANASDRRDTFYTYNAGASYTLNEHFRVTAAFTSYKNWSKLEQSDFDRNTVSLNVSSRW